MLLLFQPRKGRRGSEYRIFIRFTLFTSTDVFKVILDRSSAAARIQFNAIFLLPNAIKEITRDYTAPGCEFLLSSSALIRSHQMNIKRNFLSIYFLLLISSSFLVGGEKNISIHSTFSSHHHASSCTHRIQRHTAYIALTRDRF